MSLSQAVQVSATLSRIGTQLFCSFVSSSILLIFLLSSHLQCDAFIAFCIHATFSLTFS